MELTVAALPSVFSAFSTPRFLQGRFRKAFVILSIPKGEASPTYAITFHQYIGVPGLGIGVSSSSNREEILFLSPQRLDVLCASVAGEEKRKLPSQLLRLLCLSSSKRGFIR